MIDPEARQEIITWLKTSSTIREPKTKSALARKLGTTPQTINNIQNELRKGKKTGNGGVDITDLSHEEMVALWKKIMVELVRGGKATAEDRKTFAKYLGLLIDKSEHKVEIGFGASELARIRNEARRELEGENYAVEGSGKVRPQPPLLSEKIREG
jgi:hypothetical protein